MDKSTESQKKLQRVTPTTTDDESITTSTASDTLDSWTLVTDKKNPKPITTKTYEVESNVEDLPKYEDLDLETSQTTAKEEQETEPSPEHHTDTTSATDEFSDEVSIISESESGDILTPHPYSREHLQILNLKFTTGQGLDLASLLQQQQQEELRLQKRHEQEETIEPPNLPITQLRLNNSGNYQARQRKRRSPSADSTQNTLKTQAAPPVPLNNEQAPCTLQPPRIIRRVYTLFFYFIVALILLGVYGKLGFLEFPMFTRDSSTSLNALEKKLIDMELQNNLMRAEIDLLTKQVNYLKTINPTQNVDSNNHKKYRPNNEYKLFRQAAAKADLFAEETNIENEKLYNSGTAQPVDNKESQNNPPEMDESESNANSPNTEKPPLSAQEQPTVNEKEQTYNNNDDQILRERLNKYISKENHDFENGKIFRKRDERGENFRHHNRKYSKERFDGDSDAGKHKNIKTESKERYNDKKNYEEHIYRKEENEHKHYDDDDSKERHRRNDNSRERKFNRDEHKPHNDNNSKEHFRKTESFKKDNLKESKQKKHSNERFDKNDDKNSGEWQWKLMKHRENARNEQEQRLRREKNWYLNQKDGREQWRNEEMKHTR